MYKLYWVAGSGAFVPQALLEEIGAEFEKIEVDFANDAHKRPKFLAVNPMGEVPALVLPDGTLMTESAAIVLQLVDRHPDAKLAPPAASPERARFLRWLLFMATSLYGAYLRAYYPDRYTTDDAGAEAVGEAARDAIDRYLVILNDALEPGPYLLGETFSAVDIYLAMLASWHQDRVELVKRCPRVVKLIELVKDRPAIARIWAEQDFEAAPGEAT